MSEDELAKVLEDAGKQVTVGSVYQHYKGNSYTVLQVVFIEATMEPAVVYRANYDQRLVYVRPIAMWLEHVELEDKTVPRFRRIIKPT